MVESLTQPIVFGAPMIPDQSRLTALIAQALSTGWITNGGALHKRLELAIAEMESPEDAVSLVSSGTMALMLALGLGNLPAGAEVITTPISFAATAQAIAWSGLVPVFADVDPVTLTLCPNAVRAAITERTAAILPVHFLGVPCDMHALAGIAREHGLWLAYDAAHAFGVRYQGRPLGGFGDVSAFSLHATKILHTAEGGYIVSRLTDADKVRRMRNFGLEDGRPLGRGLNGKLSELNAAMGLTLLPDLQAELAARRALRRSYNVALGGIERVRIHGTRPDATESMGYYALRIPADLQSELQPALAKEQIFVRGHFPLLCGPGTCWPDHQVVTGSVGSPIAPQVGAEIVCLPFHGRVSAEDVFRIASAVSAVASQ